MLSEYNSTCFSQLFAIQCSWRYTTKHLRSVIITSPTSAWSHHRLFGTVNTSIWHMHCVTSITACAWVDHMIYRWPYTARTHARTNSTTVTLRTLWILWKFEYYNSPWSEYRIGCYLRLLFKILNICTTLQITSAQRKAKTQPYDAF